MGILGVLLAILWRFSPFGLLWGLFIGLLAAAAAAQPTETNIKTWV